MDSREALAMTVAPYWWERPRTGKPGRDASRRFADRQISGLHAAGLTIVPITPTQEMIEAARDLDPSDIECLWKAMLKVAPKP